MATNQTSGRIQRSRTPHPILLADILQEPVKGFSVLDPPGGLRAGNNGTWALFKGLYEGGVLYAV